MAGVTLNHVFTSLPQKAAALIKDPAAFEAAGATGVYSIAAFRRNAPGASPENILTRLGVARFIAVDPGASATLNKLF